MSLVFFNVKEGWFDLTKKEINDHVNSNRLSVILYYFQGKYSKKIVPCEILPGIFQDKKVLNVYHLFFDFDPLVFGKLFSLCPDVSNRELSKKFYNKVDESDIHEIPRVEIVVKTNRNNFEKRIELKGDGYLKKIDETVSEIGNLVDFIEKCNISLLIPFLPEKRKILMRRLLLYNSLKRQMKFR